ncbi:MAG: type II toxin-antitoxin system RelE/ParE family toxin [Planctomycetota bacterium]
MTGYTVEIGRRALREFEDLPKDAQDRIAAVLDHLASVPRPPSVKKLVGKGGYRLRQGDYRILYVVDDTSRVVRIYRVGHRREVYRGI